MSTQQDIYAAGFENRPLMLNKENYVPWSSRLLHYAKSRPNGKLVYNLIMNGPYIRRMIPELVFHPDQPSSSTYMQQPLPNNNNYNPRLPFNQKYMQQPIPNPKDFTDPTIVMNMEIVLMAKAFKLNYSTTTNNNQRISLNPRNRKIAQPECQELGCSECSLESGCSECWNQNGLIVVPRISNQNGNGNVRVMRLGIMQESNSKLMAAIVDLDEIEEVNENCILMANFQQASTLGTQTNKAIVYDSDGSAKVIQICLWCIDPGCSKHMTCNLKHLINFVWKFLGTDRFRNDHVAAILGYGDLQWGNILITKIYFVEGLVHNLFSVGQFCDSNLEVTLRRNICFIRNLEGVDLLKGNRTTNLYTINLHDIDSASPTCLMACATFTKSWLWHQCLSHLSFDTINDLARNDLVTRLPKFKYHKEHLCPLCEQGKSKRAYYPPKPVPNSK
nr:retrovirus-related Pol polyprotein from transposon TNT 1-94 [Tanacetum cinerariifolium]